MVLPKDFTEYTEKLMGKEPYEILEKALNTEPPVSIRLNPFKVDIKRQTKDAKRVPWCDMGFYLKERPAFTFDPMLHAGMYYVQEASSMFVCEVVRQLIHEPVTMLDLCAAPGGKSTALRSVLPEGSLLFSNEPIKLRASILKENIIKFGHPDTIVTNNYPKDYQKAGVMFDAILTDVPCSGEGMFRKDENAIKEWSLANVKKCSQLQRSIIEDIWPCLKPGGLLIYSTCTFNSLEDEENAQWIADELGADFIPLIIKDEWKITGSLIDSNPVYRFILGKTTGEGLFLTVLRKRGEDKVSPKKGKNDKRKHQNDKDSAPSNVKGWLKGDFVFHNEDKFIRAIPKSWNAIYNNVKGKLHIIHAGVGIGTVKGKDVVPDASLALSTALNREAFAQADLKHEETLRFLRKEPVTLSPTLPHGLTLISYQNTPLGFEKNLGNRANNLYPQEWKIKSQHYQNGCNDVLNDILSQEN